MDGGNGLKIPAQVKEDSILIVWLASYFVLIEYTDEYIQYDIIFVLAFLLLFQHDSGKRQEMMAKSWKKINHKMSRNILKLPFQQCYIIVIDLLL